MKSGFDLHLDAIRTHLTMFGRVCSFSGTTFKGVLSRLKPDDPRMQGMDTTAYHLVSISADLPGEAPVRSDELTINGAIYRVSKVIDSLIPGTLELLVVQA